MATDPLPWRAEATVDDDRTARARIRDAAIARFAEAGVHRTTLRTIAALADVSPGLVIHHFGSKDRLRVACDEHVAAVIRAGKQEAMRQGTALDPVAPLRSADGDTSMLLRYLARTLIDGSPHVAELVDEMVHDAVGYMEEGVANGVLRPTAHPEDRAALLTVWSLGALVLHEHLRRLLDVDLLGDPTRAQRYMVTAVELFADGLLTPGMAAHLRTMAGGVAEPGTPTQDAGGPTVPPRAAEEDTS